MSGLPHHRWPYHRWPRLDKVKRADEPAFSPAKDHTSSMSDFLREFRQATADSRAGRARSRSL